MKPLLKQYLLMWAKLIVMLPGVALATAVCFVNSAYALVAAVILGDGKTYNDILNDMIDRLHV